MKRVIFAVFMGILLVMSNIAAAAEAEDYSNTLNMFKNSVVVQKFFNNSYGYAVFPTIGKAGFVVGGSYGHGQVYRGGKVTGKTSVIEGSIGWQAGGEAFSEIIFFKDKQAYDQFTSGNFEFDATAQATIITAGAQVSAGTTGVGAGAGTGVGKDKMLDVDYTRGMAVFVHTLGGLMYELSLGGQKFSFQPL
jgi:lipid-binding SYLF domain-containing protein